MERLLSLLPEGLVPRAAQTGAVDWRALAGKALGVAVAVASHPLVFWPTVALVSTWLVIEVAFYFYLRYIVLPELNRLTQPVDSLHTSWDQFHKIIDLVARLKGGKYDFNRFFSGWFMNSEIKDIRRGNIREMLAWVLYAKAQHDLTMREKACMEDVLYWLKMRFQMDAPEGYNPKVRPMMLTLEKIQYVHRPLAFYAVLTGVQVVGHAVLMLLGFKRHEINGIAYWYRSCPRNLAPKERSLPLVFFHGISPGLNMYLTLVQTFSKNRKAVLVEVPHIAMCLNFKAQRLGDMVKTVEIISKRHRMPHFAVAGHSFGSLPAAWVTKHLKHSVKQLILLDPVSLLLGLPDVCYNFLHKKPNSLMEYIVHYFGATEITIHHTLRRQFWWYEGQLFLDEIRCPAFIGLSGNDEIVPSDILKVYIDDFLERHHAEEHNRYERMLAHQRNSESIAAATAAAAPLPDAGGVGVEVASYCNHDPTCRCELGKGGKGCLRQRIQYAFWPGWSHGEILFRLPTLYALDKQLREQEWFFRTREVDDTMSASMRPLPRDGARRPLSMSSRAMLQATGGQQAGDGAKGRRTSGAGAGPGPGLVQVPETPSAVVDGSSRDGGGVGDDGVIGRGSTWSAGPSDREKKEL